jgi:hypothetical protein
MFSDVQYTHPANPGRGFIDLKLAASYAPGIICVGKSSLLLALCSILTNVFWMGLTERCVIMCILLYLDRAHHKEYIIDTNACVSVAFFGVAVNELRNSSTFSVELWPWTYVCTIIWCVYSCFVLQFGEAYISAIGSAVTTCIYQHLCLCCNKMQELIFTRKKNAASTTKTEACEPEVYDKNSTGRKERNSHFIPLLITAVLLYLACNVPILADLEYELETCIRVFCFVTTSLLWLYTLNVEQMESHTIASFTPCVNRFMVLLVTGPLFLMVIVYILMISMILYRGWDLLTSAVVSSPAVMNPGVSESHDHCTTPIAVTIGTVDHVKEANKSYRPISLGKSISIIGMPSDSQYPVDDDPFDPEAAFAEISKSKAITDTRAFVK